MREVRFKDPIEEMTGRINKNDKDSTIFRHKYYRDGHGNIIGAGRKEHYIPQHPRDYKTNPMSEGERKTTSAFKDALAQYQLDKQDPERMAYWKKRWTAQLRKPDPQAPIDRKTGKRRIYARLDTFIRAMIQISLRARQ